MSAAATLRFAQLQLSAPGNYRRELSLDDLCAKWDENMSTDLDYFRALILRKNRNQAAAWARAVAKVQRWKDEATAARAAGGSHGGAADPPQNPESSGTSERHCTNFTQWKVFVRQVNRGRGSFPVAKNAADFFENSTPAAVKNKDEYDFYKRTFFEDSDLLKKVTGHGKNVKGWQYLAMECASASVCFRKCRHPWR